MSEAKFTKGPWSYDSYIEVDGSVRVVSSNITITYHVTPDDEMKANANLIAAAPEMYEMLLEHRQAFEGQDDYRVQEIDELLAKARGEL